MNNTIINQMLYLFDEAFSGPDWNSFLSNLKHVRPEDWLWVAPGGKRSIRDIVQHVGGCKFMYNDQAFARTGLTWNDALVEGVGRLETVETSIEWLREGHARLRGSIAALDDNQLTQLVGHHSGKRKETRWVISVMMQHDLYHAGEINYIRALHQGDDE